METTVVEHTIKDYKLSDKGKDTKNIDYALNSIDQRLSMNSRLNVKKNVNISYFDIEGKNEPISYFDNKINALTKKPYSNPQSYFKQSQSWVGHVIEIGNEFFTAKLEDFGGTSTYEIADFDLEEVSKEDANCLALGSVFYWSVGYAVRGSQIFKESFIRFQRLPSWSGAEMDKVADQAADLARTIKWD